MDDEQLIGLRKNEQHVWFSLGIFFGFVLGILIGIFI